MILLCTLVTRQTSYFFSQHRLLYRSTYHRLFLNVFLYSIHICYQQINDQHKRGPEACVSANRKLVCSIQFQSRLTFFNGVPNGIFLTLVFGGRRICKFSLTSRNLRIKNLSAPIQYQWSVVSLLQSLVSLLGKIIHQQYVTF